MIRVAAICVALAALALVPRASTPRGAGVGSKKFTESVILGEIVSQLVRSGGQRATHLPELGGTTLVYEALRRGEIDVYPEYTGTLREEIFAGRATDTPEQLRQLLQSDGIVMSEPLGFSNNYALAVRRDVAEKNNLRTIADLAKHPNLRLGLSNEFLDRADGWRNLRHAYDLPIDDVAGLDHDIAYRQLESGVIDVTDVYTTDAKLAELDLVLLEDNLRYFPSYDAVLLMRADLATRFGNAAKNIAKLNGQISQQTMVALNAEVETGEAREARAAANFLRDAFGIESRVVESSVGWQIWQRTLEHLDLVRRSLIPAIFVAVPLGVLAAKWPRVGRAILGAVGVVQTIPALALLVLLIAPLAWLKLGTLGSGSATAIVALFLYSLLPIVQNTATGLAAISPEYHESAAALGLPSWFRLWNIELPLASPAILAGVKTAAILNVGFATLGALVGAGGYGQAILTGIRLSNTSLILQGAIPAACLALVLQAAFEVFDRKFLPVGLRPATAETKP